MGAPAVRVSEEASFTATRRVGMMSEEVSSSATWTSTAAAVTSLGDGPSACFSRAEGVRQNKKLSPALVIFDIGQSPLFVNSIDGERDVQTPGQGDLMRCFQLLSAGQIELIEKIWQPDIPVFKFL